MITFTLALVLLVVGYWVYGKYVNSLFAPDSTRKTPALTMADGVDFIPLPTWKIFMIQFLNIAGLGPIFGAIMGAQFGTASYLWIVFGTIFAGAVHDFLSGTLSLRNNGESLPEIIGRYLGSRTKKGGLRVYCLADDSGRCGICFRTCRAAGWYDSFCAGCVFLDGRDFLVLHFGDHASY